MTSADADTAGEAGRGVRAVWPLMERTHSPRVLGTLGGLGLFRLDYDEALFQRNYREPVLAARSGSVGSRFALARAAGRPDALGGDLVATCVNDLIRVGAEPLFFLPNLRGGDPDPGWLTGIVRSIAQACSRAGCSLLDGDVAPSTGAVRGDGAFELSGFCVGVVERRRLLDGSHARAGDVVIGLASDGLHASGFAPASRVLYCDAGETPAPRADAVLDELLRPTRLYAPSVLEVVGAYRVKRVVKAMAHIADGGLGGLWPTVLPEGLSVRLRRGSWDVPPIFQLLADRGSLDGIEMVNTFNMGIGFVMIVSPNFAKPVMTRLRRHGERCGVIGKVVKGDGGIEWA